ncbi:lactate dehydrogenase [Candidatus Bipolaricaulota bacterium]|nr:lactate dehydrogenase [Candidatus Bipolaricaulota bacterium]
MNIAVIGACGDVGRQIAQQIVVERLLDHDERLVLVGNAKGTSARSAYGLAADLTDAYAEISPRIEVVLDPADIQADLIIAAAGATPNPALGSVPLSRDGLAEANAGVFHRYAQAIAENGHGHEIVVCVSNPVELAVSIFAQHLGRERVVGMGAFLDSLRFRQEIAASLGIRRQRIHAFVAGEHGSLAVPLWSGVHVYGYSEAELQQALDGIRHGVRTEDLWDTISQAQAELASLIRDGNVQAAYAVVDKYPPDVRVVTRPFVTHYSGAKTVIGTARATMEFIRTITQGADVLVSGQVALEGEAYGIQGTIGVPFVVGNRGVDRVFELPLEDAEQKLLCESARLCGEKINRFL